MARKTHHTNHAIFVRAAAYARFSCDKQRDASIEDQLYACEMYANEHGYDLVSVYTDYAFSGRSDDRPQFLTMIEDAKRGKFDVIIVWKMDRFARNIEEQYYYEHVLRMTSGVHFESTKENISGNSIEATSNKALNALFAELRSRQGAEDTMRGMIGKARRCQYLGYQWLGYSHEGDTITLDPATKDIAYGIHDRYLAGNAVRDIVSWVNAQGVKNRNGDPVGYQFITGILKNWAYAGVYTWGKEKDEFGKVRIGPDGLPIPLVRIENGIPAIVTVEVKERCLVKLGYHRHANQKIDYFLSGKVFCSKCGNPLHGEKCRNKYGIDHFRYVCKGKRRACTGVFWKDDLENAIASTIRSALRDEETTNRIAEIFDQYRAGKKPDASIEAIKADLKSIRKQRDNLIKAVEDGLPYMHVKDKIEALDAQQAAIESKLARLENERCEITKEDILRVLSHIADGARTDEEILSAFVRQVWLYEDKAIAVMNFDDRDSTPHEIEYAIKNYETPAHAEVSCKNVLVPPSSRKTNHKHPVVCTLEGVPVILLETGIGFIVSLKVA